jgi:dCTP deaminase
VVLSKREIQKYLAEGKLVITPPPDPQRIDQVSVDLRLGRKFTSFEKPPDYLSAVRVKSSLFQSRDLWRHEERDNYVLEPGGFVLAQTLERVRIPGDLVGFVEGRSSWARTGVSIHLTAPKIDPGFEGTITLEMANVGRVSVELRAEEDLPAQLMFFRVSTPLPENELYGSSEGDIFQYQSDPIPHRQRA